jgi:hypothetical protein
MPEEDRDADSAEYLMKKHIQKGYCEAMREFVDNKCAPGTTRQQS